MTATPAPTAPWNRSEVILLGCLLALIWLLARPGMTAPLLLDDHETLSHVSSFQSWRDALKPDCFGVFRPVKGLLFYHFHLHGIPPLPTIHSLVLGAYLLATISIHCLFRHLLGCWRWGLLASFLWATSATQTSTAVWLSCINISVAILFACPAILFHQRSWHRQTSRSLSLACVFLLLSLASYETALCIAPACLLIDRFRGRNLLSKPALARYLALGTTTLAYLALRASSGAHHDAHATNVGFDPDMPAWQLVASAPWLLWRHFSMWLMPFGRIEFVSTYIWGLSAPLHELAAAWGFLIILITTVFLTHKKAPLVSLGIALFLVASFPTSNLIPLWVGPVEDYYLVFPSIGLAVALVGIARKIITLRKAHRTSSAALTFSTSLLGSLLLWRMATMLLFWPQAKLWTDPIQLFVRTMDSRPAQFNCKTLIARELLLGGEYQLSKELALESIREAPWQPSTHSVLGELAIQDGDDALALTHFEECLRRVETGNLHDFAKLRRAAILMKNPLQRDNARTDLLEILSRPASDFHYDATRVLTSLYLADTKPEKALRTLERSLTLHPEKAADLHPVILNLKTTMRSTNPTQDP
ncbi:MAG: hypothetical protein EAZ65_02565 [Verrucomicrobia bacterium]|nr:MAG: hypothetical protein EAZ84_04825 [Verrucomicrobiota bacterium]TAE88862.1 MAG: hypothetical protein EAZ82_02160 [Verrucomicrobiota bacterium]TAF27279.1 MAG: hypothetical protein EAZ71_02125 [Verrucomicrobiota bacterium]TAF42430.1 MAG: hypothetical protein EAZ65_02565 [Verrucomicrobiota bacterium]